MWDKGSTSIQVVAELSSSPLSMVLLGNPSQVSTASKCVFITGINCFNAREQMEQGKREKGGAACRFGLGLLTGSLSRKSSASLCGCCCCVQLPACSSEMVKMHWPDCLRNPVWE